VALDSEEPAVAEDFRVARLAGGAPVLVLLDWRLRVRTGRIPLAFLTI
jgi:hypothetical protein